MGYAILRTQKLKSVIAINRSLAHAFREQETPNADPSRTPENTHIGAVDAEQALANLNERLATQDKVRKNAVLAIEYLIGASPEDLHGKSQQEQDAYFRDGLEWLKGRHGAENVIYAGIHRDEQTPHMYAYVVPIDQRGKLNCRAYLGGAKALNQMQTEFALQVGQQHGLQRGIEGSKARHVTVQQYYSRVKKAFEPLPKIKTIPPKLRPEPEKLGLFAASDSKEAYRLDHEAWVQEKAVAARLIEQRKQEVKAQRDAAVATARRHEAQAAEAEALKRQVDQLKRSNSFYVKKATYLQQKLDKLTDVVKMLTPVEIERLTERKRIQEAEKVRDVELTRAKAAEAVRVASIEVEVARRVDGIQKLLQRGGAEHTFGVIAATALREAESNASRIDWTALEAKTVVQAIGRHGQSAESVTKALLEHSPARVDPASHDQLRRFIQKNTPQLETKYQQRRQTNGPTLG